MQKEYAEMDKEKFINFLREESNSVIPWIQRKEVSAWSALILLYAILWSISKIPTVNGNVLGQIDNLIYLIGIYSICYIFFQFIHAQYASIYYKTGYTSVVKEIIFEICEKDNSFFEKNEIKNYENWDKYINENISKEIKKSKECNLRYRPLFIVIYLLFDPIIKIFNKRKSILNNNEKSEASIYSLIVIVVIFYTWQFRDCLNFIF
ncbi:MAG: hypothetical protein HQ541_05775 [Mariniphaga sp.]|nr:hypothetical protein [Mariniphaga sp.]